MEVLKFQALFFGWILFEAIEEQLATLKSLWRVDYFKLKILKAQKTQKKTLTFLLTAYNHLDSGPE